MEERAPVSGQGSARRRTIAAPRPDEATSSVTTALRLLKAIGPGERSLGVSELARRLGIAKSTAHRLLALLANEHFARRTANGQYALGFALWELGTRMVAGLDLREAAHPALERLRNATQEAVHLAILEGRDVIYIDRIESPATLQLFRRIGYRMPAHATSSGKAILAFSPALTVQAVLGNGLRRLTPNTVGSRAALGSELARTRARGYAASFGESEIGVNSVGAPIFDRDGRPVGAISVAGPSVRLARQRVAQIARLVKQAASEVSRNMGYLPADASGAAR